MRCPRDPAALKAWPEHSAEVKKDWCSPSFFTLILKVASVYTITVRASSSKSFWRQRSPGWQHQDCNRVTLFNFNTSKGNLNRLPTSRRIRFPSTWVIHGSDKFNSRLDAFVCQHSEEGSLIETRCGTGIPTRSSKALVIFLTSQAKAFLELM